MYEESISLIYIVLSMAAHENLKTSPEIYDFLKYLNQVYSHFQNTGADN